MNLKSVNALANAGLVLPAGSGGGKAGKNCTIQKIEPIPGGNRVTFAWTKDEGGVATATMDVMDGEGGGSLTDVLTASINVGGITSGKSYPAGTDVESIIRDLLNPVVQPTIVAPSAKLECNATRRIYGFDENIGNVSFSLSFSRGSISTGGYRAGAATGYTIDGQTGQNVTINMDAKTGDTIRISGSVSHEAGDIPKDSAGNPSGSALTAGSVTSNTITFEKKPYIYTTKNGTFERMPIQQYNASPLAIALANGDDITSPVCKVALPARAKSIEVRNEITGQYVNNIGGFDESTETIDGRTYYVYTDNRGFSSGDRDLRFTW